MNKHFCKGVMLVAAALLPGAAALAAVEVRFIAPENFADARGTGFDRDETLKGLSEHLKQLAAKQFSAGQDLLIEVSDLDRAGALEYWGHRMQEIRVLRTVGRPSITLRYVVSESGREVRRGEARVSDLSYLERFNSYASGDPIRYEKRMLDDWFAEEFGAKKKN